jgi:hypothetical protein
VTAADHENREYRALQLRASGLTFREIGIALGRRDDPSVPITVARTLQIFCKAIRLLKHPNRADHPLRPIVLKMDAEDGERRGS